MRPAQNSIILVVFFLILALCCWHGQNDEEYYSPKVLASHPEAGDFVGSMTCLECHEDIYKTHIQTAHFLTSAPASKKTILGPIGSKATTIKLQDIDIIIGKKGGDLFQQVHQRTKNLVLSPQRIDVVIGSGVKGQSYLTWEEDQLFQLQASYYPPGAAWINSPGFPQQYLKRPIRDGCLKCHTTYATNKDFSGRGNRYESEQIVFGVDCERCHRPGAKHVIFHRQHPEVQSAQFILKLDTLSRQQRLDVCAQCHSGPRDAIIKGNAFSFLAGENLEDYSRNYYTGQQDEELDVHGNQYGLLTASKCFTQSTELDCSTCHDPHRNQRGNLQYFNQKCLQCHSGDQMLCSASSAVRSTTSNQCTGCHMPMTPSKLMSMELTDGAQVAAQVRTHLIGIYDASRWHQEKSESE